MNMPPRRKRTYPYGKRLGYSTVRRRSTSIYNRLKGRGDYVGYGAPQANQLIAGSSAQGKMTVNSSDDKTGDVYYSHHEYVGAVTAVRGATAESIFSVQSYPINPGLLGSFPFLSQIAQNFTLYEFVGLVFEYRPLFGESGGSSNALGKVIMATDYDPDATEFTNTRSMENYDYSVSSKPSVGMLHGVETNRRSTATNMLYVRTSLNSARDKIFSDYGLFQVATEGIPFAGGAPGDTQTVGEVWVSYRIRLSRATMDQSYSLSRQLIEQYCFCMTVDLNGVPSDLRNGVPALWDQNSLTVNNSIVDGNFSGSQTAGSVLRHLKNNIGGNLTFGNRSLTYTFPENVVSGTFMIEVVEGTTSTGLSSDTPSFTQVRCPIIKSTLPGGAMLQPPTNSTITSIPNLAAVNNGKTQIWKAIVQLDAPGVAVASVTITWPANILFTPLTGTATAPVYVSLNIIQINSEFRTLG